MTYEIITENQLFVLRIYNDDKTKVAVIKFQEEQQAIDYANDAIAGENEIMWELQDDV